LENKPILRDYLHPRADTRNACAEPEQAEVAVLESFEDALQHRMAALRKGLRARDQMQVVSVEIGEKDEAISLVLERLGYEVDVLAAQLSEAFIEVIDMDCHVADARILQVLWSSIAHGGDNLQHGPVLCTHEIVAVVLEVYDKLEVLNVPFGERAGIRRR
jgi:hypothetical protein